MALRSHLCALLQPLLPPLSLLLLQPPLVLLLPYLRHLLCLQLYSQGNADELLSPTSSSAADVGASLASPCVAAASVSVRLQQDASVAADVALQPASVSVSTAAPAQACANSGGNA